MRRVWEGGVSGHCSIPPTIDLGDKIGEVEVKTCNQSQALQSQQTYDSGSSLTLIDGKRMQNCSLTSASKILQLFNHAL